jgi:hypothetical protein
MDQVPLPFTESAHYTYADKGAGRTWIAKGQENDDDRLCTLQLCISALALLAVLSSACSQLLTILLSCSQVLVARARTSNGYILYIDLTIVVHNL